MIRGASRFVCGAPRCSQTCCRRSEVCYKNSQMLPGAPKDLSSTLRCSQTPYNHSPGTPVPVIRYPSYSDGRQECPHRVWYSPEIDAFKYTLHILSDTPGCFESLKYIVLLWTPWSSEFGNAFGGELVGGQWWRGRSCVMCARSWDSIHWLASGSQNMETRVHQHPLSDKELAMYGWQSNFGWCKYLLYAVVSVNSWLWHGNI